MHVIFKTSFVTCGCVYAPYPVDSVLLPSAASAFAFCCVIEGTERRHLPEHTDPDAAFRVQGMYVSCCYRSRL